MSSKVPLSQIAEIVMGQSPKGEEVNNKGIGLPLLNGPTEFTERYPIPVQHTAYAKKTSLPGDILFCVRGSTTGRMNYSDQKYCIGRGLAAIRGRNGYPTPYIKAILEAYLPELLAAATGSTFPNVSKDLINNILVEVLPVANACYISKFIEAQEEKVFNSNQINKTLEQIAQALFKSWFVDFEPVKAKIAVLEAGGSQEEAILAAMTAISGKDADSLAVFEREYPEQYAELKATAELFPSAMQESELGKIPEGWSVERIGNLLELAYGKALKSTNRKEGSVPVYGSGGITGFHNEPLIPHGSIIVGRKGTVGSLFWEDDPFYAIDTTYYVRPLTIPLTYCYYAMQTLRLEKMNTDAAVPGLNRENVYRLELTRPTTCILEKFDLEISLLRKAIRANSNASKTLASLRDTLIPKLLSGKLRTQGD
ncbi:type I restriction system specificity protein [Yersinia pseudotuberculosis]|uniref:restriction endonuclease subunit S n=1 Tax=Yersinia pseudotuberculosis complex TaxID=1649845 RepID=UPI00061C1256|nr:restriction endonuclease subunit S [Yersinia similis]CNC20360.1 Predicted nucleotidyltransferases [Yersinia similis]